MKPITIEASTLASAHEKTIKYILEHGYYVLTEDKEHTVECPPITIFVDTPFRPERISKYAPQQEMSVKEYTKQLIEGGKNIFDYNYHDQLFEWSTDYIHGIKKVHNQIQYLIDKLQEKPESRRAVAIVFDPEKHQFTDESVPCLQMLQLLYRDGWLHMRVVFRSNDMLTAAGANMYALTQLHKNIADKLDYNCGSYTHIALTPHLYHVRDSDLMLKMVEGVNRPKFPENKADNIKIQSWILDHITKYSEEGKI